MQLVQRVAVLGLQRVQCSEPPLFRGAYVSRGPEVREQVVADVLTQEIRGVCHRGRGADQTATASEARTRVAAEAEAAAVIRRLPTRR